MADRYGPSPKGEEVLDKIAAHTGKSEKDIIEASLEAYRTHLEQVRQKAKEGRQSTTSLRLPH